MFIAEASWQTTIMRDLYVFEYVQYGTSLGLFKGTLPGAWLWGLRGPPACCYKSLDQQLDRFHPAKTGPPSNNNNVQHHFHLYYSDLCEFLFYKKGYIMGQNYICIRYIIKRDILYVSHRPNISRTVHS